MNTKILTLLVVILGSAALFGCSGSPQAMGERSLEDEGTGETLSLEIEGNPETEFSGSCAVGDAEPEQLGGQIPESFTYNLEGKPLECEIASEGQVEVVLTHGNNRSVQRTSGGTLNLTYENGSTSNTSSSSSEETVEDPGTKTNVSGNVASERRDVSGFDEVELRGVGNLSIRQTGSESLTVEAEEDVLPKIETEIVDHRLIIGPVPDTSIQTTEPINYELTVKDLRALEASGSGAIDARGIKTGELAVTISGTAEVEMSGRAENQEVNISGSGAYEAQDLESRRVQIGVEGTGSAVVNASEELDARVGGTGSVEYEGNPTVNQDVSGVGRVSKH